MGCISATGGAHAMSYFTKKREKQQHTIFFNVTTAANPPFSNYSSIYNSSQLSIPQEIMSSGTVHATDLCITAQRLLAATKMHGKWEM